MERRQCVCCRARFTSSRNPNQHYCENPTCQKKRRCRYQQKKLSSDADYRSNQRAAEKNWHARHPAYWQTYRHHNPQQVIKNREAQAIRNKKRIAKTAVLFHVPMIATMYSFNQKNNYLSLSYSDFLSNEYVIATIGRYSPKMAGLLTWSA